MRTGSRHCAYWNVLAKFLAIMSVTCAVLVSADASEEALSGATLCLDWADKAALEHSVPTSAMRALAIAQSGKQQDGVRLPWPWTVKVGGIRRWFSDSQAALDFVERLQKNQFQDVYVGCFLVELQPAEVDRVAPWEAIEPHFNAELAARRLSQRYRETSSWNSAINAFPEAAKGKVRMKSTLVPNADPVPETPAAATISMGIWFGSLTSIGTSGTALTLWREDE